MDEPYKKALTAALIIRGERRQDLADACGIHVVSLSKIYNNRETFSYQLEQDINNYIGHALMAALLFMIEKYEKTKDC